jgi:hypothetical protein
MKCREVHHWLYSFRPNTCWPAELVDHLQQCPKCQRVRAELQKMDQQAQKLGKTTPAPDARQRLLDRVAETSQSAPARKPERGPVPPWIRLAGFVGAAAAMILFGWFLGHDSHSPESVRTVEVEVFRDKLKTVEVFRDKLKTVEVFRDKLIPVPTSAERDLFASLVKRNVLLVQASQIRERLEALLEMAGDCRQHALFLIQQGPRDQLPWAINLYGKVLREGVLVQLVQAEKDDRPMLTQTVRTRLEKMSEAPPPMKEMPKAVAEQMEALRSTTTQTMELLDQPEAMAAIKPAKFQRPESLPPPAALILFAITVSNEPDPVVKAEICSECIHQLMPSVLLALADEGPQPQPADLGQQFGELIRFGVYSPLATASAQEAPELKQKAEQVMKKANQAVETIQKNLQEALPEQRPGLERVLEATKKGKGWQWDKAIEKKGKGKEHEREKEKHSTFPKGRKASLEGIAPVETQLAVWTSRRDYISPSWHSCRRNDQDAAG